MFDPGLSSPVIRTLVVLIATTALFALSDRHLLAVPLALQYVLSASLLRSSIGPPLYAIRLTLALAITAIVYITAGRVTGHSREMEAVRSILERASRTGPIFRLLVLALAALLGYGVWSSGALPQISEPASLTAVWLLAVGGAMLVIGTEPLGLGIGLLVVTNGFLSFYLSVESSLLIVALAGLVEITMALGVAYISETWIEGLLGGAPEP